MKDGKAGFTVLEVLMAAMILTVGTMGFLALMAGTIQMEGQSSESVRAVSAAQDKMDEIWDLSRQDFSGVYDAFQGQAFDVAGLEAVPSRSSVGDVTVYDNEAAAREALGLSSDLDLDRNGIANENEIKGSGDLRLLPARIHLEWQTPFGVRTYDLFTIIYNSEVGS